MPTLLKILCDVNFSLESDVNFIKNIMRCQLFLRKRCQLFNNMGCQFSVCTSFSGFYPDDIHQFDAVLLPHQHGGHLLVLHDHPQHNLRRVLFVQSDRDSCVIHTSGHMQGAVSFLKMSRHFRFVWKFGLFQKRVHWQSVFLDPPDKRSIFPYIATLDQGGPLKITIP